MSQDTLYFYVIRIREPQTPHLYAYLNTMRLLASPDTRNEAHVTIRGPKRGALNNKQLQYYNDILEEKTLAISEPGTFFGPDQNTVYLQCRIPEVKPVWEKPDYGDGINPHLTLYDGASRAFAEELLGILQSQPAPCFYVDDLKLEKLESTKSDQKDLLGLRSVISPHHFEQALGSPLTSPDDPAESERLRAIRQIWHRLGSIRERRGDCLREKDLQAAQPAEIERQEEYA